VLMDRASGLGNGQHAGLKPKTRDTGAAAGGGEERRMGAGGGRRMDDKAPDGTKLLCILTEAGQMQEP